MSTSFSFFLIVFASNFSYFFCYSSCCSEKYISSLSFFYLYYPTPNATYVYINSSLWTLSRSPHHWVVKTVVSKNISKIQYESVNDLLMTKIQKEFLHENIWFYGFCIFSSILNKLSTFFFFYKETLFELNQQE